jgi:hypothetical protein
MSEDGIQIRVDDLHQELSGVPPGSPQEKAILGKLRDRREHKTGEFRVVRNEGLEQTAENGVVDPNAAKQIGKDAITHAGGSHEIPITIVEDPGRMH